MNFSISLIEEAYERIKGVVAKTPLQFNKRLSEEFQAEVYLKREDLQPVRSYKLRGAYNRISLLTQEERENGTVTASAGNHAQGVALSCSKLNIKGVIVMPKNTPRQKIERVRTIGGNHIEITLFGDTYDEAYEYAQNLSNNESKVFIHPFNDLHVIAGQGTIGLEILKEIHEPDVVVLPVGGGGILAGVGTLLKEKSSKTEIIGVEPKLAASMAASFVANKVVTLETIDKFVDGAAVKTVGELTFQLAKKSVSKLLTVEEGKICKEMIALYQNEGIVTEPAGALSVAALEELRPNLKGKKVVCVISGGNNDISRYSEIIERSLVYQGLKHYFIVEFSQRPGALRQFLDKALGPNDDITLFEYMKKNNRESGPALVGIELSKKEDYEQLTKRMKDLGIKFEQIIKDSDLFRFLV
jgi:threonine dehydratase